MALYVGLDISLRMTSICVVEADGWYGKAKPKASRSRWSRCFRLGETKSLSSESKLVRFPNGFTAHWLRVGFRSSALRPGMHSASYPLVPTRPTAAMRAASLR
jgi:hypothetical protein